MSNGSSFSDSQCIFAVMSACLSVCMFLVVGQMAWPIGTKLGTQIHLDSGIVYCFRQVSVKVRAP